MEPITTALAGIALVQKSVDFIKSNINTVQDIRGIVAAVDRALDGEQQLRLEKMTGKDTLGKTKDAAQTIIDQKLAQEQMDMMKDMIERRFGFGTWKQIIAERTKRQQEEKEELERQQKLAAKRRKEFNELINIAGWTLIGTVFLGSVLLVGIILL